MALINGELFPNRACLTWPGGSRALGKVDFSPLDKRKVILWADNDEAGRECMDKLARMLQDRQCEISLLNLNALGPDWPPKGDTADAQACGHSAESLLALEQGGKLLVPFNPARQDFDPIRAGIKKNNNNATKDNLHTLLF